MKLLLQGGSSEEQLCVCLNFIKALQTRLSKDKMIKYLCLGSVRSAALGEIQARVPFTHIYLSLWATQHPGQLFVHQSHSHGLISR